MTLIAESLADQPVVTARVLIVEDHVLVAQSLAALLRGSGLDVSICKELTRESVLATATEMEPDVVVLDLDLGRPGREGLRLIAPLTGLGARVVVVTGVSDRAVLGECVEQGAAAVAAKSDPFEEVVDRIQNVLRGEPGYRHGERERLVARLHALRCEEAQRMAPFERLSRREREVLAFLMEGLSAATISERSYVSLPTVRSQINSLLKKLGASSQLGAVAAALAAGFDPRAAN